MARTAGTCGHHGGGDRDRCCNTQWRRYRQQQVSLDAMTHTHMTHNYTAVPSPLAPREMSRRFSAVSRGRVLAERERGFPEIHCHPPTDSTRTHPRPHVASRPHAARRRQQVARSPHAARSLLRTAGFVTVRAAPNAPGAQHPAPGTWHLAGCGAVVPHSILGSSTLRVGSRDSLLLTTSSVASSK